MKKKLCKFISYSNVQQFPQSLILHIFLTNTINIYFFQISQLWDYLVFYQKMFFSIFIYLFIFCIQSLTTVEVPPEVHIPLVQNFRFNKRWPWNVLSTFMLLKSKPTYFLNMLWPLFLCHLQDKYHDLSAGEALQFRGLTVVTSLSPFVEARYSVSVSVEGISRLGICLAAFSELPNQQEPPECLSSVVVLLGTLHQWNI